MPTRFWELCAGGLVYLLLVRGPAADTNVGTSLSALGLAICFLLPTDWQLASTLMAVTCTSLLILTLRKNQIVYKALTLRPVVFVGTISYSLYLWHWSILVLGKWTIGDSFFASIILIALTILFSLASYFLIEKPLRYSQWGASDRRTITIGILILIPSVIVVHSLIPSFSKQYYHNIAALLDVSPPKPWLNRIACHGKRKIAELASPFQTCLSARRTNEKPNIIYLLGDSHAAHLHPMMTEATHELGFSVRFINPEDRNDFPYGFMKGQKTSKILDFVADNSVANDVVAIAFHRGRLNERRDKHIPLTETVSLNDKSRMFISGMKKYIQKLEKKGVHIILINDTPLMNTVTTSSTCLIQIKMFGKSICRVEKKQDLHTRLRQDMTFFAIKKNHDRTSIWDPSQYIYKNKSYLDVVDENGKYIMWDWNHITKRQSTLLAPEFQNFIKAKIGSLASFHVMK
jgi:hypothetical protein